MRSLAARSPAELRDRAVQAFWQRAERLLPTGELSDSALGSRLSPHARVHGLDGVAQLLKGGTRPAFFPGMDAPRDTARLVAGRFPGRVDEVVREATAILEGRFRLLGYPVQLHGVPPQWHRELARGVTAPDAHWSTIDYLDPRVAGDHKLLWEVNRHQWMVTLGQAWQLTGDARFAHGAATFLRSWLDANPPRRGVNWASSLEVAYRAIAWTWAHRLLRDAPPFDEALQLRWLKALDASARHVERYLSTWFSPNTHLIGEALGLLYVGTQFPELQDAPRWAALGWRILDEWLPRQVRADGTYFEQATYYHRYTLDIFLHACTLGSARDRAARDRMVRGVERLAHVLAWITRADGTFPLFGDEDGGKLLFLDGRASDDARASLAFAALLLGDHALKAAAGAPTDELAWLAGRDGLRAFDAIEAVPPAAQARAFDAGGLYVIRDGWSRDSAVLTVDCGPLGTANGGHAHADTLAFDLAIGPRAIFVDAGTVSYTTDPGERDELRRSHVHNTLTIDGVSSSEPVGPFRWASMTPGICDVWIALPHGAYFEGHHEGYARLDAPAIHRRSVLAVRNGWWLLRDEIESAPGDEHDVVANFQCATGLDLAVQGEIVRVTDDGRAVASVAALGGPGRWTIEGGVASRRYGAREPASRARYAFRTVGGRRTGTAVTFAIVRAGAHCHVTAQELGGGQAITLRAPAHEDLVLYGVREAVDGVRTDARVAWIRRRSSDGVAEALMMVGGTRIEVDGVGVAADPGGIVSATRGPGGWQVSRDGNEHGRRERPRP
ncbi:MAG TPA: alginate lyase family protein [Gemmatimonadaceae bacterium]|nr:alginate lyase family protein [Gemmatimonadaceae bacterium]